jgi:hypothetical protein
MIQLSDGYRGSRAYRTEADALDGSNPIANRDSCSLTGSYWVINSYTDRPVYVKTNLGKYIGEHLNAVNLK